MRRELATDESSNPIIETVKAKGLYDGPFAILFTVKVKSGEEERLIEQIKKITPISSTDKGNLYFEYIRSTDDLSTFTLFEKWVNGAALASHLAEDLTVETFQLIGEIQAEPPVGNFYSLI